jgi:hypothetical protein
MAATMTAVIDDQPHITLCNIARDIARSGPSKAISVKVIHAL